MARLRRLQPDAVWFVTVRCERRQFRLRPDRFRTEALGFHVAAANAHCPGIQVHAVCQMTNHIHLVLTDTQAQLSDFMMHLNGSVARAINGIDQVKGRFFERRFAASQILDHDALIDRIVYTLCNPASAGLVDDFRQWPGICQSFAEGEPLTFQRFDRRGYEAALRRAERSGESVEQQDFVETRALTLVPARGVCAERVAAAVDDRQQELGRARRGAVVGVAAVLAVDPFDAPKTPARKGPNPLCHTSIMERLTDFRRGWRAFVDAYKQASARFRSGDFGVRFPPWSFRPHCPLIE